MKLYLFLLDHTSTSLDLSSEFPRINANGLATSKTKCLDCNLGHHVLHNVPFFFVSLKKSNERVLMREGANYEVYTFNIGIENIMKCFIFIFFFSRNYKSEKMSSKIWS